MEEPIVGYGFDNPLHTHRMLRHTPATHWTAVDLLAFVSQTNTAVSSYDTPSLDPPILKVGAPTSPAFFNSASRKIRHSCQYEDMLLF